MGGMRRACITCVGQEVSDRSLETRFQLSLRLQCCFFCHSAHRLVLHFATGQLHPLQVDGALVLPSTSPVRKKEHLFEPDPHALLAPRDKDQHRAGAEPSCLRKAAAGRGATSIDQVHLYIHAHLQLTNTISIVRHGHTYIHTYFIYIYIYI